MNVAILSDIHDNTTHLLAALLQAEELGCTHLLFAGDMAELSTFRTLRDEWKYGIDLVFGNNEYDLTSFLRLAEQFRDTYHHGAAANLELNKRRIFLTHYPHIAMREAQSGAYDAVFYGHTHCAEQHLCGHTLVANPGEVAGVRSTPSMAVYNTVTNSLTHHPLA